MQNDMTIDGERISTWYADHAEPPYHAVNMTQAAMALEGYDLTEEEKSQMPALMAGYCRLIDELGLIGFGESEFEAIQELLGANE